MCRMNWKKLTISPRRVRMRHEVRETHHVLHLFTLSLRLSLEPPYCLHPSVACVGIAVRSKMDVVEREGVGEMEKVEDQTMTSANET